MTEHANMEHVKREYAAFLEDDLDAVLQMSAPDIEYRYPQVDGLTYGGVWRGRDQVRRFESFFDTAAFLAAHGLIPRTPGH